jgi:predicted esterase
LPWHFHGELSIGGELLRSANGIRQSLVECRIVLQQLQKKGGRLFGGWGTSYGGWIMALLSCYEPLLQRLILVEPILNIENAIWHAPMSIALRRALRQVGLGPEDTASSMRLACPVWQKTLLDPHHILMLAGQYDKIAPPAEIEELSRLWGGTHFACFPQGHVGYTLMPESFRMIQELWPADFDLNRPAAVPVANQLH